MSDEEQKSRQRRAARSGALGRVLEQMSRATADPAASEAALAPPADSSALATPARTHFFPRKGPATVPPEVCRPWEFADRPEAEFGHVDDLVRSFRSEGQIQPVVVRPLDDPAHPTLRYEVIAGQARWRAAKQAGTLLEVVVRPLDDEAAFRSMVSENEFRRSLSDYAKAKRLALALTRRLYPDKKTMAHALGMSASQLSYFLGFAELDPVVVAAFKRLNEVSARLGYSLHLAAQDGYVREVLRDLPKIESGEIPRDQVPGIWRKAASTVPDPCPDTRSETARIAPRKFVGSEGRALFALRVSPDAGATISVPRDVARALGESFWDELAQLIEQRVQARPESEPQ